MKKPFLVVALFSLFLLGCNQAMKEPEVLKPKEKIQASVLEADFFIVENDFIFEYEDDRNNPSNDIPNYTNSAYYSWLTTFNDLQCQ